MIPETREGKGSVLTITLIAAHTTLPPLNTITPIHTWTQLLINQYLPSAHEGNLYPSFDLPTIINLAASHGFP